jgi:hypothetical protein
VVKALKVRDGSPHDVPLVQFGWDTKEGRHVYLGEKSKEESQTRKLNDLFGVAQEIFANKANLTTSELTLAIMEAMDIKDRQARTYIKFMKENNIIEKNPLNSAEFRKVHLPF